MSMPRGRRLVPFEMEGFSDGSGPGKRKGSAIPASVAKTMNGIVQISIPTDI